MACEYICDSCGKRAPAEVSNGGWNWLHPLSWFMRADENGPQDACSSECAQKIADKSGKTNIVTPF